MLLKGTEALLRFLRLFLFGFVLFDKKFDNKFLNEGVMWQRGFHFNHYLQTVGKSNLWGLSHFWGGFTLSSLSFMRFYDQ